MLWAVANTLTIFAVRDVGLSIAFPLWNSNSLLWNLLGHPLLQRAARRGLAPLARRTRRALLMFVGATALASLHQRRRRTPTHFAASSLLSPPACCGHDVHPLQKSVSHRMSPLSFITFFTVGELGMMTTLAVVYSGGLRRSSIKLSGARHVLFWLLLGGFVWVIGDLFQQYAVSTPASHVGFHSQTRISCGASLAVLVFGELSGATGSVLTQVIGGSLIMALGAGVIAFSS